MPEQGRFAAEAILRTRFTFSLSSLFALALFAQVGCEDDEKAGDNATPKMTTRPAARVVVISVDGLRPDAIRLAPAPTIMELASRAAYTWDGQTIRPSITLPSHTSMMTGTSPTEHGVVWNDYRPGYVRETTPTVLKLARDAGMRAVLVSGKEKFFTLAPPGGTTVFVWASGGDMDVAASAIAELDKGFNLALIHFPGTDDMGHAASWMSPSYLAQVRVADAAVAQVLKKLPADTTIILTADHGGLGNNHAEDIPENTTIPWIIVGPGVRKNHQLNFDVWTTDTAGTVAYALGLKLGPLAIGRAVEEAFESFKGTVESCGDVANDGPIVMEQAIPGAAPSPAGGATSPGLYQLSSATVYTGDLIPQAIPSGRRFKTALRITKEADGSTAMEQVEGSIGGSGGLSGIGLGGVGMGGMGMGGGGLNPNAAAAMGPDRRSRFRIATTDSKLERKRLCSRTVEPGTTVSGPYTASGDELMFFGEIPLGRDIKLPTTLKYTRQAQ